MKNPTQKTIRPGRITPIAAALALALSPAITTAAVLEEVMVTANKREQNMQDVGISVSAFSGEQMDALGATNTTDIIQQVPGLQLQSFTPAFTAFNLRGISQNNFQDVLEAPVAVYVNDAYVGSMNAINGQLFDVERVEVLRGPQGTLFGRNATGGLLHYVTKNANEDELNGYVKTSIAEFNKYSLEGAIGGALADNARGRIAARWEKSDGYVENEVGARDSQGADGYALRAALQFDLSDDVTADIIAAYSKDDDVPTGTYVIQAAFPDSIGLGVNDPSVPDAPANKDFSDGGYYDRDSSSVTAKVVWAIDDSLEFTSITNTLALDKFYLEDADGSPTDVTGAFFEFSTAADYSQWSQEFRLSGEGDNFRWQTGLYYLDIEGDYQTIVDENLFGPVPNTAITTTQLNSSNWSVFGQGELDLNDSLILIAGLRWSQDDKDISILTTDDTSNPDFSDDGLPPVVQPQDISGVDTIDYGDYAARLQLNYTTEAGLYFAAYNRGIKGGNWSPGRAIQIENFRHDEEVLHSYELGTKLTLLDGLARLNATVFYYDYQDYQQFSLLDATPQVVNRDATSRGGEIELFLTPGDHWDIVLGLSVIDSEVDSAPTAFPGVENFNVEFPNAPDVSFNTLVRYGWEVAGGEVAFQFDGVYTGEQYLEGTNNPASKEDSYFVGNASVSYTSNEGGWKVAAWLKNFTDEEYRLYHLDLAVVGFTQEVYAPPRWAGVTFSYNFGD